jgi:hypothetical protein
MKLESGEIKNAINEIKDGVDKSCFGPLFQYPDMGDITQRQINQVAFGVFTIILTGFVKNIQIKKG